MPTVSNLFFISSLLCVVQLLVLWSLVRSGISGIREWMLANGIAFLAFILYALGQQLPPLIAYEFANASYAWASTAMAAGFFRFFGRPVPWRSLLIINLALVAAIAWFHYVHESFAWRTIVVSVSQILFLAYIGSVLLQSRRRWSSPYPYLFTASMAVVVAMGHAARAGVYLLNQGEMTSLLQPSPWNIVFLSFGAMILPVLTMGAVMIVHDRMMAKAEHEANRDFLTGAWSRRAFFEFARREMALLKRRPGKLALLVMDVDHFKSINDRWGHAAGDQVLIDVVSRAGAVIRSTDYFARIGGEEFAVLLPDTGPAAASIIAERLRQALDTAAAASRSTAAGPIKPYTVSMGLTALNAYEDFEQGLQRADAALYQAKQAGRNRVVTDVSA